MLNCKLLPKKIKTCWVFFSQFRNVVACTGDHPEEELVKFCYKSERKVENFKNTAFFFLTYWNLLYKYGNCKQTKIPQNLATLAHKKFPQKILV
jgi:hypothetical protein